ncbi:MAG: hypothetical protein CVT63_01005 [Candidatus Anoxymicrobium japonicum]|uniref:4Fe-4S ferredoxin-type domain-containing protein n=1 Tax=Candidatus Anoxymicrobium japonicum TaxID=2013648 RepID=A0A2N3G7X0_9ACTN|nr:MAG: hypothetical protein CVT63_01005 [Candidatus Anoxymicrobium japonicum]
MQLKMPWIDRALCKRELDCKAALNCKKKAFHVQPASMDEPGLAAEFPLIDLEECKRCGDCEKACANHAVKMI